MSALRCTKLPLTSGEGTASAWEAEAVPLDDTRKMLGVAKILQSDGVTSHLTVVEERYNSAVTTHRLYLIID